MLVPLSWLAELVPLGVDPTDATALRALAEVLNGLGLVVEHVEQVPGGPKGVVLARVLEIRAIEGLDRVRLAVVDAGEAEPLEVACGAWNFAVGDVVPLATIGTRLPDGRAIDRRRLRGVVSNGMLCSPIEVGLGQDADGLLVLASTGAGDAPLPPGMVLGAPLEDFLCLHPDAVFDLAIEANRPDCLCIAGVARDLGAKSGLPLALPEPELSESGPPASELASVAIRAPQLCDRLTARVLTGVQVAPSTGLVARRLRLAGLRPVNSVVDASNYAMLELGQPTHPYDLDRLGGAGIVARAARPGEVLATLDGTRHALGVSDDRAGRRTEVEECVIADARDHPVGLAGIMGGEESEITDSTTRVLLEAALFEPLAVGRAAQRRNLRTDASIRFWRGVDPLGVERASARVCELIVQSARSAGLEPPAVAPGLLDATARRFEPRRVVLRTARVNALLGTALDVAAITSHLEPLGFAVERATDGGSRPDGGDGDGRDGGDGDGRDGRDGAVKDATLIVTVPSFRPDTTREVDVTEEVARLHGYEHIAPTERRSPSVGRLSRRQSERRQLCRLAASLGAYEAWTASLVDPQEQRRAVGGAALVPLANPMAREESVLRAHLLPGLLEAVRYNVGRRNVSVRLFEVGRVFSAQDGDQPVEREQLAIVFADELDDARSAVHAWRFIAEGIGLDTAEVVLRQPADAADVLAIGAHPTRSASIVARAPVAAAGAAGVVGEVDPQVLDAFDLRDRRVGWLLLDLEALLALPRRPLLAPRLSRQPPSDIDLAFSLPDEVTAAELGDVLLRSAGEWCEWVRLIDVYRGPGLPEGTRSLAYRLRFRAPDHTLTDAEVGEVRARCIAAAEGELAAVLRG
jgi:phenylalanyl-tRNA synthetase beta chain